MGREGLIMTWIHPSHLNTGRKLNVPKTFIRRPGRLLNAFCTFNLRPVSRGPLVIHVIRYYNWNRAVRRNLYLIEPIDCYSLASTLSKWNPQAEYISNFLTKFPNYCRAVFIQQGSSDHKNCFSKNLSQSSGYCIWKVCKISWIKTFLTAKIKIFAD